VSRQRAFVQALQGEHLKRPLLQDCLDNIIDIKEVNFVMTYAFNFGIETRTISR
jgi:hypothetical protein